VISTVIVQLKSRLSVKTCKYRSGFDELRCGKSTLRLPGLKAWTRSGLTLSGTSLPRFERWDLAPPNGSTFCFHFLFLFSSGPFNILQIELDERRHLRWLPICLFGFLGPDEWQMPDLPWFFDFFEYFKSFQKNFPLTFPVSHLSHGPAVRICNGSRSGYAYRPVKFIRGCENNGGKSSLF
jgi:hypothetical protein